ncbi:MAG: glycosyltransferase family 9 protein [Flavobacteriales bacterium]|nr:glycosyltransferase family 9 protein [Flavobacteriales bacterium]MBK6944659.1 glycosyltransferase family 9 protein [Flavobacteriales bacterium]MBK7241193.1 glycosyltransferase family 9 protein [Flavobacteriales bacterium]MBK9534314.1 glycosyltransferase family 9 protein [Flavobacteriales bacterium]MBP9137264.1 glycosyltransferase family 9 protein [Flavobacteriales bacterium]
MERSPERIILSRTDSIGDVMLTLPLAGLLKQWFPNIHITFLGRSYTAPILRCCEHVDSILTMEELEANNTADAVAKLRDLHADAIVHVFPEQRVAQWAKKAAIPIRIGTSHRWWHWFTANERVSFSRKNSDLHEAQLNVKLLAPFGITDQPSISELAALTGFRRIAPDRTVSDLVRSDRKCVILHPRSKGSAAEWGLDRFTELIELLDPEVYQVIITGTASEASEYRYGLPVHLPHVTDTGGKLNLDQLIALIGASDALIAASTGPLHIAAACGVKAIGLYPTQRPMHPGRWSPLGKDVHVLVNETAKELDVNKQVHAILPSEVLKVLSAN